MMKADAIFEGGGVKAFGMLGALLEAEQRGYQWENLAGSSAGAIIAALAAAGYNALEIKEQFWQLDFRYFKDVDLIGLIPIIGNALNLWFKQGLYLGNYLENLLRELLAAKGIFTFKDLVCEDYASDHIRRYKLVVTATDVTRRKLLRLPHDFKEYGIDPDSMEVCKAVRMSSTLPFFFQPYRIQSRKTKNQQETYYLIDGGVLSNFPVWVFDDEEVPLWPTFGFKVVETGENETTKINNPFELFKAILSTMLEAHDKIYESNLKSKLRTISIPSLGIKTTDFDHINKQKDALFQSGRQAAVSFFDNWNFESFKLQCYTSTSA
ncbi:MAG: patatin-like phospholipase family protein [Peptococcaceae bacterium]|nr:patatin-like phospholipase family protein [Peptococcaceae bacterium]